MCRQQTTLLRSADGPCSPPSVASPRASLADEGILTCGERTATSVLVQRDRHSRGVGSAWTGLHPEPLLPSLPPSRAVKRGQRWLCNLRCAALDALATRRVQVLVPAPRTGDAAGRSRASTFVVNRHLRRDLQGVVLATSAQVMECPLPNKVVPRVSGEGFRARPYRVHSLPVG